MYCYIVLLYYGISYLKHQWTSGIIRYNRLSKFGETQKLSKKFYITINSILI